MTCCELMTEYQQRTDTTCTLDKIALQRLTSGNGIKPELALTYSSYYLYEVYVAHEQLTTTQSACTQIKSMTVTQADNFSCRDACNYRYELAF